MKDLRASVDRDRLVERLVHLVRTPSENPPGAEAAVSHLVASQCAELALEVETHEPFPGRPSVIARWRGDRDPGTAEGRRARTVCYCSHIDVVPAGDRALWRSDPFGATVADGRLHGRGACDAKGPVAAALEAVAALRDAGWEPAGTLELALVADEEAMGFRGAGHLVAQGILAPDATIVGEPTALRVVRAQRGACWVRITTRGVAAHGSAPERGVSAIRHMAEIVSRLEETLPIVSHPLLGAPTISVGTIHGGDKVNIVPPGCVVEVDRRTIPGETKESAIASVQAAIEKARGRFPELDAVVETSFFADPFETPESSSTVAHALAAAKQVIGEGTQPMGFRGASDARFFAEAGGDVVVWGPGDITLAHTARESIDLDELEAGAVAYAYAFSRMLEGT